MKNIFTLFIFVSCSIFSFGQNFEMNRDLGSDKVSYQSVIATDSLTQTQLTEMAIKWEKQDKYMLKFVSEDAVTKDRVYEIIYNVKGKKSELGKEYDYRFSTVLKLEFKDQKVRYTFNNFIKKTSPGEPGMSMENYIAAYKPKISSTTTRDKSAMRLDEIETTLQDKVNETIEDLKKTFSFKKDEW
jgi:hypothetical protein